MKKKIALLVSCIFILSSLLGGVASATAASKQDTITVVTTVSPSNMDPYSMASEFYYSLPAIFETLVETNAKAVEVPLLAQSWVSSPDKRTLTFKIREGVKFHNGKTMNVDDIIYSFQKFSKSSMGTSFSYFIKSYKKIDNYTLNIVKPDAFTKTLTTLAGIRIIPKDCFETDKDFAKNPIGTGAYKFVSISHGQSITMTANTSYWGKKAKIKNVIVKTQPNPSTQLIAIETGEIDFISTINSTDINTVKKISTVGLSSSLADTYQNLIMFKGGLMDDVKIREAIYHGINPKNALVTAADNYGKVVTEISPASSMNGFYNKVPNKKAYDPALAKKLMKEANYDSSKPLVISCLTPFMMKLAQSMQADLAAIGMDVKIELLDQSGFIRKYLTGGIQMMPGTMEAVGFDIYQIVKLFSTQGDMYNVYAGKTAKYDALVAEIMKELDPKKQKPLIMEALKMLKNNYYIVPLFAQYNSCAYSKRLNPIKITPFGRIPPLNTWSFK